MPLRVCRVEAGRASCLELFASAVAVPCSGASPLPAADLVRGLKPHLHWRSIRLQHQAGLPKPFLGGIFFTSAAKRSSRIGLGISAPACSARPLGLLGRMRPAFLLICVPVLSPYGLRRAHEGRQSVGEGLGGGARHERKCASRKKVRVERNRTSIRSKLIASKTIHMTCGSLVTTSSPTELVRLRISRVCPLYNSQYPHLLQPLKGGGAKITAKSGRGAVVRACTAWHPSPDYASARLMNKISTVWSVFT